ncbi:hypothetical protein VTN00DRAFT_1991 [Thermoascus crustaceus]|uniref:uncharacterized protein n=1 Tax=Thermoascus crustaceus TaxID=5088 RepID=UPI0037436494
MFDFAGFKTDEEGNESLDQIVKEEEAAKDAEPAVKTPTSTPRKRGRKKAGEDAASNTPPSKKSKISTPNTGGETGTTPKKAAMTPIPTSYENMSPEDKMMLHMKDVEGKSWAEIKSAWEAMTGNKVGGSTLSGRYGRIKANLVQFKEGDEANMLEAKKEIEEKFESEKWHKIAEAVEAKSGNKYPPAAVQKKLKELSKRMPGTGNTAKDETEDAET